MSFNRTVFRGFTWFLIILCFLIMLAVFVPLVRAQEVHENKNGNSERLTEKDIKKPVSVKYFYSLPAQVGRVLDESMVGVRVSIPKVDDDGTQVPEVSGGTGFAISDDGLILTSYHLFPPFPTVINDDDESEFEIYDGADIFKAKLILVDTTADLAAFKVMDLEQNGKKFSKKSASIASLEEKEVAARQGMNFYAFKFVPKLTASGDKLVFPLKLGPYLMETNWIGEKSHVLPFGVIQGVIDPNFSGASLIGEKDGKVYGVLSRMTKAYSFVVTIEVINHFINSALTALKEKTKDQNNKN